MRRIRAAAIAAGVLLAVANVSIAGGQDTDSLAEALMRKAAKKDTEGLAALRDQAMRSPGDRYAYHLARYMADPSGYADTFIEEFPATSDGVMSYVYQLELATGTNGERLTPYFLYSFGELGKLAIAGNPLAIGKLYGVAIHSDGVVTEFICERVSQVIAGEAAMALDELANLPIDRRRRVYNCFGAASADEIRAMQGSMKKATGGDRAEIAQEVSNALDQAY